MRQKWRRIFVHAAPGGLRSSGQALLRIGCLTWPCRIGAGGIGLKSREGDGRTPSGILKPLRGFWRQDRGFCLPSFLSQRPIRQADGWCDAPAHRAYNRLVRLPFAASHEALWRNDHAYDVVVEMSWNTHPRRQGRGSAIFLHLTNAKKGPTAGCIAVDARRIARVMAGLARETRFILR